MTTVTALLDTSVLVDVSRNRPVAMNWLKSQSDTLFGLPVLVCMELVDGARSAAEREQILKLLAPYPVVHLIKSDSAWAQTQHARFKLTHNVGIIDALIAAAAFRLAVPVYTLNVKHFSPLPGVSAYRPY